MEDFRKNYIIRSVAGSHYLLDIGQRGLPYRKPICINEMGADICRLIIEGKEPEDIIVILSGEYRVSPDVLRGDVMAFIASLNKMLYTDK